MEIPGNQLLVNPMYYLTNMLTQEQIKANIQALEKQGASQKDIQSWLDSLKTSDRSLNTSQEPAEKKSLGRKILDFGVSTAKSLAETGIRSITETSPVGKVINPVLPESVDLPVIGETSLKYSEEPKKRLGQMTEDLLTALPSPTKAGIKNFFSGMKNKAVEKVAEMTLKTGGTKQVVKKEAWDIIKPDLNKVEKISALSSGQAKKEGLLNTIVVKPTQQELKVAQAVQDIVSSKNTFVDNINSINKAIENEANNVISYLEKNKIIYSPTKKLNSVLGKIEKPVSIKADPIQDKMYDLAREKFVEFASKQKGDLSGLLKARKEFDKWVEKEFPNIWKDEKMSNLNRALKDMRKAANDFIASKLPDGDLFKESLNKQSLMFDAIDNIATKNYKDIGTNVIQRTLQKNPTVKAGLKYGAGGVGLGWVGSKILGD